MTSTTPHILGWAAGGLLLIAASATPASAAGPAAPGRPSVSPAYGPATTLPGRRPPVYPPSYDTRMPGSDWWRIYPWSPYNAWKNPYWYPPYNTNYPYPPDQASPYNPYLVPRATRGNLSTLSYPEYPTPYVLPSYPEYPEPITVPSGSPPAAAVPSQAALDWPLALRILPPAAETQALRQEIDARLTEARRQATAGHLDPGRVRAMDRDVDRLNRLLRQQADFLPTSRHAISEAENFLARLKDTIKTLR